jgi:putative membrane protein
LQAASGAAFDHMFVTTQLAGHARAMQAGQVETAQGTDPGAITVASDSAPVMAAHHQALQDAAKTMAIPLSVDTGVRSLHAGHSRYVAAGLLVLGAGLLTGIALLLRRRNGHRHARR